MRDSQPLCFRAVSCVLRHRFASGRLRQCLLRQCLLCVRSLPFVSSQAIIRQKPGDFRQHQDKMDDSAKYFRTHSDIFGHFRTLRWDKWAISLAIFRKYRHFAIQSLNTHSPPPDISDIFLAFEAFCKNLQAFFEQKRPSPPASPTHQQYSIFLDIYTLHRKAARPRSPHRPSIL